ncbi:cytidine deaminase [Nodosilinea sp. LEGE 06152]|uniref:cytidine deaminase n=1 Tax=Nodosilinea sp. LEGE 06152 TaxID=2777966 RepID=UPI001880FA1D|nr:cytidine deaminase [Nodosilinea sp. LEGE 06152]MBE9157063.1 cytidine deaminase [Nodosilinea sp. LEGE 06152]
MKSYQVDDQLVNAAKQQALSRFPEGWSGAAAMYTETGRILTSVYVDALNEAACLCHETGAICEAHRLDERICASVCVSKEETVKPFVILTPCGICQERLAYWGLDVEVGVPDKADPTQYHSLKLREVQPYYWHQIYSENKE